MKRILIFSLTYHPYIGGAEVAIKEITDRIDSSRYQFDMITLRFDRNLPAVERVGNVTVHRIGFTADAPKISDRRMPLQCKIAKILFPFTSFVKAVSLHREHAYDMIWAMMANYAAFGALAFKYTHPRVPYLLELQDGNSLAQVKERQPVLRLLWPLYRRLYLKADVIKAISRFIERLTREVGYAGPVVVIPNAVDTTKFSAPVPQEKLDELKNRFDKKKGDTFLFTASRLVLSRGVEDVIRALPHLPVYVKFLIAGDGQDREKLESIAREAGVYDRVIFAGHVGHDELPAYFKVSDIFVRPSIIEGFGNAFVEAFAAGIPVVATEVGGIPDFLFDPIENPDHAPTGIFCKVRDPESVASAVRRYLDDPALAQQMVTNARALAIEKYDWHTIAADMEREVFGPFGSRS
ncbi:glycosyltransferase family 4 protein [Candidatus Kaiserbacteria bacterium]|nr:glycosyltransferase family 4 protein [Candidatus Kaiserbacteria bacterium]